MTFIIVLCCHLVGMIAFLLATKINVISDNVIKHHDTVLQFLGYKNFNSLQFTLKSVRFIIICITVQQHTYRAENAKQVVWGDYSQICKRI
jgi:hypothetical protein